MTDGEMHGIVLQKTYEERHARGAGFITIPLEGYESSDERNRLDNICSQLA